MSANDDYPRLSNKTSSLKKVALVTGATAGIGRAIVEKLADSDYLVIGCGRRKDRLAALEASLGSQKFVGIECDVANDDELTSMLATVEELFGGVDVLVNNAGFGKVAHLLSDDDQVESHWRQMFTVNVTALAVISRRVVRSMMSRNVAGHVVNISSMSGHRVPPMAVSGGTGMYAASKHAVNAITETLRVELRAAKSPIRVTQISPGLTDTEFFAVMHNDDAAAAESVGGDIKKLECIDIANAVHFALTLPKHAQIHDILIRPTDQMA
jgi:17beta-estradiol 17-dehydrogenase / 3beta-hydroxysteroid 3-dehydrogenase